MRIHKIINELERELNAQVVVEKIRDFPAVTEPNVETRRNARTELINLRYSLLFFQYKARERIEGILAKPKSRDEIELEQTYTKMEILERGLNAERVVQEESGHTEYTNVQGGPCSFDKSYDVDYIIDSPEITAPDIEKREASKRALEKLYEKTKYVTAKRRIEKVLGYAPELKQ